MIEMLEQPIYSHRAYVIVGVNKKDPTDIIGYCENSFSMEWSRHWVNVWSGHGKHRAKTEVNNYYVDKFCELYEKGEEYCKFLDAHYKKIFGKFLRKAFSGKASFDKMKQEVFDHFMRNSTYASQGEWNYIRHYPSYIPDGYEMKIFRLNSKNCPIMCDLRHRYLSEHCKTDAEYKAIYSKWDYRNPMFVVKAKVSPDFKWPADFMHSVKMKKAMISKTTKYVAINYKDLSHMIFKDGAFGKKDKKDFGYMCRSSRQILKKQRRNSFAAKEEKLPQR